MHEKLCGHCGMGGYCQVLREVAEAKVKYDERDVLAKTDKDREQTNQDRSTSIDMAKERAQLYDCPNIPEIK